MNVTDVVGTWRLLSYQARMPDGTVRNPMGANPAGRLTYDRERRMAVQFQRRDRPRFANGEMRGGTPEEMKAAYFGYVAYYGAYRVDEATSTVTHVIQGSLFPNWEGQAQERFVQLAGNRLTITTPPFPSGGQPVTLVLVWEREEG